MSRAEIFTDCWASDVLLTRCSTLRAALSCVSLEAFNSSPNLAA
ncbi:hypothetical protein [Nocardiopsis exhalans]|nr:hypothetical protein [Nocardiopsis exhalans]